MSDAGDGTGTPTVSVILRHNSEVLLLQRRSDGGSHSGQWGVVSGRLEGDEPDATARREIGDQTALDASQVTFVRAGPHVRVDESSPERARVVHPFLFESDTRAVETNRTTEQAEWVPPTEILRRNTVPGLWETYDRVRPTVETVVSDTAHGSTTISIRALEVLRDEAAIAEHAPSWPDDATPDEHVRATARDLLAARPAMAVVTNRINRTMATADRSPAGIHSAAIDSVRRAYRVDAEAASSARDALDGARVATLSRSGTVLAAIEGADVDDVLVAESRPGREGIAVAEQLVEAGIPVTLTSDAGFAFELSRREADVLVLGADSILEDGRLVNKVGTWGATLAAVESNVPVVVVTTTDKIRGDLDFDLEPRDADEIYAGDAAVEVSNPTFDVTPPAAVDVFLTERGPLSEDDVRQIADEHAALATWTEEDR